MTKEHSKLTDFNDVDRYPGGRPLTEYLERLNTITSVGRYKDRVRELLEISPGDLVLDAGCGTGAFVLKLIELYGQQIECVGIDKSNLMIQACIAQTPQDLLTEGAITFLEQDLTHLDFPDNYFNVAYADRVLQHLPNPAEGLEEIIRVTKPGGRIVIADPLWDSLQITGIDWRSTKVMRKVAKAAVQNPNYIKKIRQMMQKAGIPKRNIVVELFPLDFSGMEEVDNLFWFQDILGNATRLRIVSEASRKHCLNNLQQIDPSSLHALVDLYIVRGIKK